MRIGEDRSNKEKLPHLTHLSVQTQQAIQNFIFFPTCVCNPKTSLERNKCLPLERITLLPQGRSKKGLYK